MVDYEDVTTEENNMNEIRQHVDQMNVEDEQLTNLNDIPERPEQIDTVMTKFRIKAEIPKEKKKYFENFRGFYGTHVAYSNSPRQDNLRHKYAIDLCRTYENLTYVNHSSDIMISEVSEFQMTRGNQEVGGFEAKLGLVNFIRQEANIRRNPIMLQQNNKKKKFLGIFPRKNKTQVIQGDAQ